MLYKLRGYIYKVYLLVFLPYLWKFIYIGNNLETINFEIVFWSEDTIFAIISSNSYFPKWKLGFVMEQM